MPVMNFQFNTILVPVDFSVNTRVAIDKAVKLCEGIESSIHLFYVDTKSNWLKQNSTFRSATIAKKLSSLASEVEKMRSDVLVKIDMETDRNVESAIAMKAKTIGASLIVIGKKSTHSWLPFLNSVAPSRLSELTHIPVLTVKPGAMDTDTKTVVVPIGAEIDGTKFRIMEALCRKARIHIHLLAFLDAGTTTVDAQAGSFLNTFDWVKKNLNCPMKYAFVYGDNKAKALLKYCRSVDADLLLVSPVSETKLGWMNSHISDVIPANSRTQILSVQSFNF
jgi:nucleotide-binding universal stress UspA family protein